MDEPKEIIVTSRTESLALIVIFMSGLSMGINLSIIIYDLVLMR